MNHLYITHFLYIAFCDPHKNPTRLGQLFIPISPMRKMRSGDLPGFTTHTGERRQIQAQVWLSSLGAASLIFWRTLKPWKRAHTRWPWQWSILKPSHVREEGKRNEGSLTLGRVSLQMTWRQSPNIWRVVMWKRKQTYSARLQMAELGLASGRTYREQISAQEPLLT